MFGGVGEIISKYIPMYIRVSTSFDLVKSLNMLRYHTWVKGKSENIKVVLKKKKKRVLSEEKALPCCCLCRRQPVSAKFCNGVFRLHKCHLMHYLRLVVVLCKVEDKKKKKNSGLERETGYKLQRCVQMISFM